MRIQIILALGAMILLSMVILSVTKTTLNTEDVMYNSGFGILATSLGTSIIEEATRQHFDNITDTTFLKTSEIGFLSAPGSLGPDAGENIDSSGSFNDFDDFNGYTKVDSTMPSAVFEIRSIVQYVKEDSLDVVSNVRTWHKRITVTVTSESMQDTIVQSSVFSYWNMR